MTPSQRQSLIRVARSCARQKSWGALVSFVEAYDARPRSPISTDSAAGSGMPASGPNRAVGTLPTVSATPVSDWFGRNRGRLLTHLTAWFLGFIVGLIR